MRSQAYIVCEHSFFLHLTTCIAQATLIRRGKLQRREALQVTLLSNLESFRIVAWDSIIHDVRNVIEDALVTAYQRQINGFNRVPVQIRTIVYNVSVKIADGEGRRKRCTEKLHRIVLGFLKN